MSTYSPNLRIQLIATGDQVGTWGTTTNTNLGTLLEDAISGYTSVSVTSSAQALTANNGSADQSRNASLALTTTTTAAFAVYAPPAEKTYTIYNASSYTATIYNSTVLGNTTAAGVGAAIPAGKTATVWSDGTNFRFQNNHLSSLTLATDLAIADGGTGASTAADARTNLGLGTMATQASSSVSITGGSITGITDLAVADGGTGASTAANARTNLGLAIGSDVQAYNAGLQDISGLAKTDGNLIVGNGTNWVAESGSTARTSLGLGTIATQNSNSVTITGGSISGITDLAVADGGTGASDAATARTNLGLAIGTNVQAYNAGLQDISGLLKTAGNIIVANGTNWVAESGSTARTSLGLGTIATQNSSSVSITGGSISGITDLAVADGGTGASTAANARTNLGLVIGTDVQAYNAGLADIAGLAKTDGNLIVGNGTNWVAESGSTARTSLGLGTIATQNSNSVTITGGSITGITDLAVADGGTGASTAANARTNLGLVIGTDVQAYNAGLTDIAGLAKTDGNLIVGNGTNWVAESGATARTSLGLGSIATQAASSVAITGGSITGITDLAVADGGTGASSFTSGSLLKGNGTAALSVASAADIVAAIGSTAVANATTAANGGVTSVNGLTGAVTVNSLGDSQTWTDVTASRALNTTYTNSTGRSIQVICAAKAGSSNHVTALVGSVTIVESYTVDCCGVPQYSYFPLSFVVPAGATYRVNGSLGFSTWTELR